MSPRQGEIWKVRLLNKPKDKHQSRPAIVVSINPRNQFASDVLVVPLSSTLKPLNTHVLIPAGSGGIDHDSMAKCEQITTIDKEQLESGPLGPQLDPQLMEHLISAIFAALTDKPLVLRF